MKDILTIELRHARGSDTELFRELDALGIDSKDSRALIEDVFEDIGKMALRTYKSSVPLRTNQLQGFIRMRSSNRVLKVISIESDLHTNSKTKEPIPGDLLGDILEEGQHRLGPRRRVRGRPYRRSRSNRLEYTAEGQPTANWAENALETVLSEIGE